MSASFLHDEYTFKAHPTNPKHQPEPNKIRTAPSAGAATSPANVLYSLGFSKPKIHHWLKMAKANGSIIDDEILSDPFVNEEAFYGALAKALSLPFEPTINPKEIHYQSQIDANLQKPRYLRTYPKTGRSKLYIIPELTHIKALQERLALQPELRQDLIVTTRSAMRSSIWEAGKNVRSHEAVSALSEQQPANSARHLVHGKQGFVLGIIGAIFAYSLTSPSSILLTFLHLFCSCFYLLAMVLRLCAALPSKGRSHRIAIDVTYQCQLPIYTILVPLHREHAVIKQLITGLDQIDWPRSRLDIKLICEADDELTLAALKRHRLGAEYEIVQVPPSQPRTKPKALQYAMPAVRGEFLTVYDAEDRPHQLQLREAYGTFLLSGEKLACLQSPLAITNISHSWLTTNFALEYCGLFRRILPMLARNGWPLPLGGTSNHFKVRILREVGGWDPFNVTEDADLGMRLSRAGYDSDVLHLPTLEDAPTSIDIWIKQRTRWYKGWLKTWLVMMRSPIRTAKQLGAGSFAVSQLLIGGMLLASLGHPLMLLHVILVTKLLFTATVEPISLLKSGLFALDSFNLVTSYLVFALVALSGLTLRERVSVGFRWLLIPFYWLMLSAAAWRAIYELKSDPFRWNKTPHTPSRCQ